MQPEHLGRRKRDRAQRHVARNPMPHAARRLIRQHPFRVRVVGSRDQGKLQLGVEELLRHKGLTYFAGQRARLAVEQLRRQDDRPGRLLQFLDGFIALAPHHQHDPVEKPVVLRQSNRRRHVHGVVAVDERAQRLEERRPLFVRHAHLPATQPQQIAMLVVNILRSDELASAFAGLGRPDLDLLLVFLELLFVALLSQLGEIVVQLQKSLAQHRHLEHAVVPTPRSD